MSIQFLVILVPVILGMMGFALDLGRIYLVRGELNQAATAMAMAAAAQLNGTTQATASAEVAANATLDNSLGDANKYNFGSLVVGQGDALLTATTPTVSYYATLTDAQAGSTIGDGTTAQYVSVNLSADAPLLFWSLFSFGQSRKTSVAANAIAGFSAPLCTACDIDPFAIAPIDATDLVNFGFVAGNLYTFYFQCAPGALPAVLAGTSARVPYVLIGSPDPNNTGLDDQQLFQVGAQGLLPSPTSSTSQSCMSVNQAETLWTPSTSGAPLTSGNCAAGVNVNVQAALCGLSARLSNAPPANCQNNTDLSDLTATYSADTDPAFYDVGNYTAYTGNNRRILTVPIVDALATAAAPSSVQCFRQFLLEPNADGTLTTPANYPADTTGSFIAMYLGVVAPVRQGRFDGGCGVAGPGKVVLHQ